jgi:DNA-binding response OmpR family regulator
LRAGAHLSIQDGMTASASKTKGTTAARAAVLHASTLPPHVKILYITTLHRTGGWLAKAFAADNASEVRLEESVGVTAGLTRLRDEVFDAVLISHEPGVLDALDLIEGLRAGGSEEPMIALGTLPPQDVEVLAYEVGADAYCCVAQTTTRSLLWTLSRAIERHALIRENRRLLQAERQRLAQEHQEAERLLAQQRALVEELESLQGDESPPRSEIGPVAAGLSLDLRGARELFTSPGTLHLPASLPPQLVHHYREILRAYVIMGSGNLNQEMATLAELLCAAGVGGRETMQLHVCVLEELVHGLGSRSARHVMNRGDLLVLEVLIHVVENYRRRYQERHKPPEQLCLPGFEESAFVQTAAA